MPNLAALCALYPCFYAAKSICVDNEYRFKAKERRPRRAGLATPNFPKAASFFRRVRTSRTTCVARFFPKKGCSVRLNVGERAVVFNICEALGSLKANLSSKKPRGKTPSGFVFQAAFAMLKGSLKTSAGVSAKLKRAPYFSFVTPLCRLPLPNLPFGNEPSPLHLCFRLPLAFHENFPLSPQQFTPDNLRQPTRLYYNS